MASIGEQGHVEWQASADEAPARLEEAGAPGLRFTYSYAINAIPILGRVLSEATRGVPGQPDANADMPESWLTEPIALQKLYRIAREPRDIVADLDAGWVRSDGQPVIRFDRQQVDSIEHSLRATELVRRVSGTFDYEITERGRAFLEIIGPEGEVPDIVGRWRSEAGVIPRTAGEPMDVLSHGLWLKFNDIAQSISSVPTIVPIWGPRIWGFCTTLLKADTGHPCRH